MSKHSIMNVPRWFSPYTNDCFQNAYGSVVSYLKLNPDLILADYLSFVYDPESGFAGMNYLHKESASVEFSEEELNIALEYVYFPATANFSMHEEQKRKDIQDDEIKITWYIDDDQSIAYSRMKELIDNDMPVVVVVDLYYIKYHKAYQKEHGLHAVVITGYNEEENYVELFDKYRFSNCDFDGQISIDELMLARTSENCSVRYSRPIRNLWMEFSGQKQFIYNEKRWMAILEESCRRMCGEKDLLGCKCGLNSMEDFRKDLLAKKDEKADQELMDFFRFYYSSLFRSLSRSRNRFNAFLLALGSALPEELVTEVTSLLKEAAKGWEINANLSIRLAITKNLNSIEKLNEQLNAIWNYENEAVGKLYKYINSR
ncbi:MAG: BtrH N-terminal domain-containing protein [Ruminiclostridium sp.]